MIFCLSAAETSLKIRSITAWNGKRAFIVGVVAAHINSRTGEFKIVERHRIVAERHMAWRLKYSLGSS